ncbi:MAG: hypothetical protein WCW53_01090 [Syntrophales bacterium]|jgi:hypothetical protein
MEDQDKQEKYCQGCGNPIVGGSGEEPGRERDVYCRQCQIDKAEEYIKDAAIETPKLKRLRETTLWKIVMVLILFVCMGIVAYQYPQFLLAFKEPKPVRMGTYATDAATDNCIKNLWQLAYDLQQGKKRIDPAIVCPAAGKPYIVIQGPNPEVHCPNPGAHGFRDIAISKNNPVPELIK